MRGIGVMPGNWEKITQAIESMTTENHLTVQECLFTDNYNPLMSLMF